MAQGAPSVFTHRYQTLLELIRFGPAIFTLPQFMALLFHVERSVAYAKDSDRHSEKQALEGIYATRSFEWVRGPSGLGRTAWYKANAELAIDVEDPSKTPDGVIVRTKGDGRYGVVEYQVDLDALRRRIARWKDDQGSVIRTPEPELRGPQYGPEGSIIRTPETVDNSETAWNHVARQRENFPQGSAIRTQQSDFDSRDLDSRSDASLHIAAISLELEIACNERPRTDKPAKDILGVHETLRRRGTDLPFTVLQRFLHDKGQEFRARRYPFNPALLAKSFGEEIFRWLKDKSNEHFISAAIRERDLARARAAEVKEMPPAATKTDSEFTANLPDSLKASARKLR